MTPRRYLSTAPQGLLTRRVKKLAAVLHINAELQEQVAKLQHKKTAGWMQ
jgi:hypothetical protein